MLLTEAKQHLVETKPKKSQFNLSIHLFIFKIFWRRKKIATKKKSYIAESRSLQPATYKNPESFTVYLA